MGEYTNKLSQLNKEINELIFLLNLSIDKKEKLEKLVSDIKTCKNEIIIYKEEILKNNNDYSKLNRDVVECNQEFNNYISNFRKFEELGYQLSDTDELKFELKRLYDTLKF